jgi:hypothetical protein
MTVELTYVALKPLRVGGERREPGELVPEAETWPRVSAWVSQGRIAAVAKSAVDPSALKAAEKRLQDVIDARDAESQGETEADETTESETTSDEVTKAELYEQAQELDIEGRSSMDKEELTEAIEEAESSEDDVEEFATGSGWYEVPGAEKKMRRDEAIEYLAGLEDEGEE